MGKKNREEKKENSKGNEILARCVFVYTRYVRVRDVFKSIFYFVLFEASMWRAINSHVFDSNGKEKRTRTKAYHHSYIVRIWDFIILSFLL